MKIEVTRDGIVQELDVDLSLTNPGSLREQIRLEEALGPDLYERIVSGEGFSPTPRIVEAFIWAKLAKVAPDVRREEIDVDFGELAAVFEAMVEDAQVITMPMQTPDGDVVEVEVGQERAAGEA